MDRLAVGPDIRQRLIDSIELCFREAGEAVLEFVSRRTRISRRNAWFSASALSASGARSSSSEPEPGLFSFNNPYGACPRCQGFGNTIDFDLDLVIPDKNKTLAEGAVEPWTKPRYRTLYNEMKRAARAKGIPLDVPYYRLTPEERQVADRG